jgi:hypothetical protein
MTLTEYQTFLHNLYRGDGNTPTDGDTKWNQREYLLHAGINMWEHCDPPVLWNELWTTLSAAATGDKTVNASDLLYDMPDDFVFLGSYVRTTTAAGKHTYYKVIQPEDAELYKNTTDNAVFVTGNKKDGHVLNFLKQPTTGDTINYPYYKEAFEPTTSAQEFEMSDPWFAVYFALGKLHEQEGAGDRSQAAYSMADAKLKSMKTRNIMLPHDQTNRPRDDKSAKGYSGFGSSGNWGVSRFGETL